MYGRGLDILYVESLIFHRKSHRTLFLSGKSGTGKTHFVKSLGYSWVLTGCISCTPIHIDSSTGWGPPDILGAIVKGVTGLELTPESIDEAKKSLHDSARLIVVDDVEPRNLLETEGVDTQPSLQDFIQGLSGGKSVLIIVSRQYLRDKPKPLSKQTKACARFHDLVERGGIAIQEVTLDILRDLGKPLKLDSKDDRRALRRLSNCLDDNPQLIRLFLKSMIEAGMTSNLWGALHQLLFSVVKLPLHDPESRMVRIAGTTFAKLGRTNNGHQLQKLLLCLAPFNNFIPCGLYDKFFFPSAKCYLGHLRHCGSLEWPASADPGVVKQHEPLGEDPSLMYFQLSHLAEESKAPFCVLVEQLLESGLVDFPPQVREIKEMREAVNTYYNRERDGSTSAVEKLLEELGYLSINPALTHYLRLQFSETTDATSHGLEYLSVLRAYCSYYKSFSANRWNEHDSHQPNHSRPAGASTTSEEEHFTSDSVYLHDARNIYSAVHIAFKMPKLSWKWESLPFFALVELGNIAVQIFKPQASFFKRLPTGIFAEETILSLYEVILTRWESAPRTERESPKPLMIAATISFTECILSMMIGNSQSSEFGIDMVKLRGPIRRAVSIHQRLRLIYGTPGQPPTTEERYLTAMLEDSVPQRDDRIVRRLLGDEGWSALQREQQDDNRITELVAAAVMGGLQESPFRR